MRFSKLSCDASFPDYGGSLVSRKHNNGEFDYWLVIRLDDLRDCGEDAAPKWQVTLASVSPAEAKAELQRAFESCGIDPANQSNELVQVEALVSYGIYATLWAGDGNNYKALLKTAREQAKIAGIMYGFMMDRPVNALGTDGWDAQRGNITAGIRSNEE